MWDIDKTFTDYTLPLNRGLICLNSDKAMNPYTITYPIIWSGFVGSKKVKIIQKDSSAILLEDFNFEEYPDEFSSLKAEIIDLINDCLKRLD